MRAVNDHPPSGCRSAGACYSLLAQQRPPIIEQVAKTYGLDSFGQIDAIRYTWNAQFPE